MQIKRFSELDDNILEKIIHKHFCHWSKFNSTMTIDTTREKFLEYALNKDGLPFGIAMFDENDLIGFLVFKKECLYKYPEFTPWISDVMIFDKYRGKGYGRKLISEALKILKKLGYKKVYLWTDQAPLFYQKIGFQFVQIVEKNEGGYGELYSIDC